MSPASFDGLHASSFDAYRPEKWSSNVFTRERLEVKQRLLSLARMLEPTFEKVGLKVQRYASDEYPSLRNGKKVDAQWVFFWRTEEERLVLEREVDLEQTLAATIADPTPMTRHAFVCLRLDHRGLELSARLHRDAWVDQHNLLNKLGEPSKQEEFTAHIKRLPEAATVSISEEENSSHQGHDVDSLIEMVRQNAQSDGGDGFLRIGVKLDRETTIGLSAGLVEHLEPLMNVIAEIYNFVAWSEANNFISSDEEFLQRRAQRGARRKEHEANQAERRAAQEVKRREQEAARKELEELFRREATAARSAPPRRPRTSAQTSNHTEKKPREIEKPLKKEKPRPQPTPAIPQPVQTGHMARVARGPLAGQVGLVQEVDARGNARIMVGLLATRIQLDELIGLGPPQGSEKK